MSEEAYKNVDFVHKGVYFMKSYNKLLSDSLVLLVTQVVNVLQAEET